MTFHDLCCFPWLSRYRPGKWPSKIPWLCMTFQDLWAHCEVTLSCTSFWSCVTDGVIYLPTGSISHLDKGAKHHIYTTHLYTYYLNWLPFLGIIAVSVCILSTICDCVRWHLVWESRIESRGTAARLHSRNQCWTDDVEWLASFPVL